VLLENGADVNLSDSNKEGPLYIACTNGHTAVVEVLMKHASPDVNEGNAEGETCLITAAWHGHADVVAMLIGAGADVDKQNSNGKTSLIAACWRSFPEVAKAILDAGIRGRE
jgi:ankyrin repeat protein